MLSLKSKLYLCGIGDELIVQADAWERIRNAFLGLWKHTFHFLGHWRYVRKTEKRPSHTQWGTYHLGSHIQYTWVFPSHLQQCVEICVFHNSQCSPSLTLFMEWEALCWTILNTDRMEMLLPSSWTHANVNITQAFERQLLYLRHRVAWMRIDEESETRHWNNAAEFTRLQQIKSYSKTTKERLYIVVSVLTRR